MITFHVVWYEPKSCSFTDLFITSYDIDSYNLFNTTRIYAFDELINFSRSNSNHFNDLVLHGYLYINRYQNRAESLNFSDLSFKSALQ